jgi:hypothetical protein
MIFRKISLLALLCSILCASQLYTQAVIEKIPSNMAIRFKNNSSQKVHALFIYTPDFSNVFKVGGWSEQSLQILTNIANLCATAYDEKQAKKAELAAQQASESQPEESQAQPSDAQPAQPESTESQPARTESSEAPQDQPAQPEQPQTPPASGPSHPQKVKLTAAAWVSAAGKVTGLLVNIVSQPGVILETMRKKDYFKHVLPGVAVYSHKRPVQRGQILSSISTYKKPGEITVAIYPDDNYGLPDFKAPLFIADFDITMYNSVTYGPQAGHAEFQYIDPVTKKVTVSNEKLFVPVRAADDGSLKFQTGGQAALDTLHQKEEELNVTLDF